MRVFDIFLLSRISIYAVRQLSSINMAGLAGHRCETCVEAFIEIVVNGCNAVSIIFTSRDQIPLGSYFIFIYIDMAKGN